MQMHFRVMNLRQHLLPSLPLPVPGFALLPPDNASGNFVKVVQRLPAKIEFTKQMNPFKTTTARNECRCGCAFRLNHLGH